jgi:capsular polysaccharide export protein
MARDIIRELSPYKNILLLQGPKGFFFYKVGKYIKKLGKNVYKINFNGGDLITYLDFKNSYNFTDKIENFREFLENFIKKKRIDLILMFGDYKPYHKIAIEVCQGYRMDWYVFEEGYVRPHYITMEKYGVNGFSNLPKDTLFYLNLPDFNIPEPKPNEFRFYKRALSSFLHYIFLELLSWKFPHYRFYKNYRPYVPYVFSVLKGVVRKQVYKITERSIFSFLTNDLQKKYFLVPLQVYNDSQIVLHSKYNSVKEFIEEVLTSFAKNALKEHSIVFKHHPIDRGFVCYKNFIKNLSEKLEVKDRVFYVHDLHLPTLIKSSLGVVVINSTVGLQSLYHNIPVKVMGEAIYNIPGLTFQGSLDDFWKNPGKIDRTLFRKFYGYVIKTTQLNGSFWGKFPFE